MDANFVFRIEHLSPVFLPSHRSAAVLVGLVALCLSLLAGCGADTWNNPYPADAARDNTLYGSFSERPKHLDPGRSYSSNEYAFIAQIYEPPLQYHFLKRPYQLQSLSAAGMPQVRLLDAQLQPLPADSPPEEIVYSDYIIEIRPGMHYQPHPALARDAAGSHLYHRLDEAQLSAVRDLADFPQQASREVRAEDYVYQIKRLANPSVHSPIAGLMSEYILGFAELAAHLRAGKRAGAAELRGQSLSGAEVLGPYRYRIRIKGSYPQFVYWLAMPFFAPMPWEADAFYQQQGMKERNISLDWYPLGSGPFMLTENNPNRRMVLQRNPHFHGERYPEQGMPEDRANGLLDYAGRSLPLIERAVYSLEKENIPYWNKFLQGYYDTSGVSSDSFDQAVKFAADGEASLTDAMRAKGISLDTAVTASIFYMGFNMMDSVVGGLNERGRALRQAISIAVDFEEFVSIFMNGRGEVAQGPLPPGIFGYREGAEGINPTVYRWRDGVPQRRPIEDAKALLAKAGYPGGKSRDGSQLILYFDTTGGGADDKARLNWYRKQFAKLDIELVIRSTDYNRFQEKMRHGTGQIFVWGWNADYPDPENFLFLLYGPNSKVEGEGENAANYRSEEYDRLFEEMKNAPNGPQRQLLIDRMLDLLRHDAPWVWGYHPRAFSLHHAWYKNAKPNLMANNTLKYKALDVQARAAARSAWNRPVTWPLWLGALLLSLLLGLAARLYLQRERGLGR